MELQRRLSSADKAKADANRQRDELVSRAQELEESQRKADSEKKKALSKARASERRASELEAELELLKSASRQPVVNSSAMHTDQLQVETTSAENTDAQDLPLSPTTWSFWDSSSSWFTH